MQFQSDTETKKGSQRLNRSLQLERRFVVIGIAVGDCTLKGAAVVFWRNTVNEFCIFSIIRSCSQWVLIVQHRHSDRIQNVATNGSTSKTTFYNGPRRGTISLSSSSRRKISLQREVCEPETASDFLSLQRRRLHSFSQLSIQDPEERLSHDEAKE